MTSSPSRPAVDQPVVPAHPHPGAIPAVGPAAAGVPRISVVVEQRPDPIAAAAAHRSQLLAEAGFGLAFAGLVMTVLTFRNTLRSNERQARAYVNVDGIVLERFEVGHRVDARIEHANLGQTPATDIRVDGELVVASHDYRLDRLEESATGSSAVLGAGQRRSVHCFTSAPLTQADLDELRAGRRYLILTGRIRYVDAFGRRRETGFTQRGRDGGPSEGDVLQIRPHGNFMA